MEQDNRSNENQDLFSKRLRAGRRRTYFFDVRATRSNDYYLTITESKKRFNQDGYDRHKIFLYKEDFNKFLEGLQETIDHIKTELLPEYDFDEFTRRDDDYYDNKNRDDDDDDDDYGHSNSSRHSGGNSYEAGEIDTPMAAEPDEGDLAHDMAASMEGKDFDSEDDSPSTPTESTSSDDGPEPMKWD